MTGEEDIKRPKRRKQNQWAKIKSGNEQKRIKIIGQLDP
jgi:hypothetical protein